MKVGRWLEWWVAIPGGYRREPRAKNCRSPGPCGVRLMGCLCGSALIPVSGAASSPGSKYEGA